MATQGGQMVQIALCLALGAALISIGRSRRKGLAAREETLKQAAKEKQRLKRSSRSMRKMVLRDSRQNTMESTHSIASLNDTGPNSETSSLSDFPQQRSLSPQRIPNSRERDFPLLGYPPKTPVSRPVRGRTSEQRRDLLTQSPISYVQLGSIQGSGDSAESLVKDNGGDWAGGTPSSTQSFRSPPQGTPRPSALSPKAQRRTLGEVQPSHYPRQKFRRQTSEMGSLINRGKHIPKMGTPQGGRFLMQRKLILVMVGLPARGKSYIVKMITRYLRWIGFPCETFNIGNVRRKLGYASVDANFFKGNNREMLALREKMANMVQDEMYEWLAKDDTAKVALFDATNTTKARRKALLKRNSKEPNVSILFIESICDDSAILERNYSLKLENDDYKDMDPDVARKDFELRVKAYEKVYETIDDNENDGHIKYIKIYNVGRKITTNHVVGYLPSQVSFFLQNIHISPRKIYLTLHAESIDTLMDSDELTEEGREYAMLLAKFIRAEQDSLEPPGDEIMVLTGTQEIHTETIGHLTMLYPCAATTLLNSNQGLEDLQNPDPQAEDLIKFAGITGESYFDVIHRVRPLILELERQTRSLVVVSQKAIIRCLYAYFVGVPMEELKSIQLDMHTLVELVPGPFGTEVYHRTMEDMQLIAS